MIALGRSSIKIHLALDPCDMRKSCIEGMR